MYWYACKAWAVDVPCIYFIYVQQSFLFQEDVTFDHPAPSAPLVRQESILARGLNSECVICLDRQVQYFIFCFKSKWMCMHFRNIHQWTIEITLSAFFHSFPSTMDRLKFKSVNYVIDVESQVLFVLCIKVFDILYAGFFSWFWWVKKIRQNSYYISWKFTWKYFTKHVCGIILQIVLNLEFFILFYSLL